MRDKFWLCEFSDTSGNRNSSFSDSHTSSTPFAKEHGLTSNANHIISAEKDRQELQTIADDLNRIYEYTYNASPFSVEKQSRSNPIMVKSKTGFFSDAKYIDTKFVYVLIGDKGFNWYIDRYTKMLYEIISSGEDIVVDIIEDKFNRREPDGYDNAFDIPYKSRNGFLSDRKGGYTPSPYRVYVSNALSEYKPNSSNYNYGGVTLHELLRHIHPNGFIEEYSDDLKAFYKVKLGSDHDGFQNKNKKITSNREELEKLKGGALWKKK